MCNKIPKIIHYFYDDANIWEKGYSHTLARICINSWKRACPDYKLMLWHDKMPEFKKIIKKSKFVQQAYKEKLWAFVSDYIRLYALYNYGGIYLDTDVELLKSFDDFLNNNFFISIEGDIHCAENIPEPAVMGAVKEHPLILDVMKTYENSSVYNLYSVIANVTMKKSLKKLYNFKRLEYNTEAEPLLKDYYIYNKHTRIKDFSVYKNQKIFYSENKEISIYPSEYFCPSWVSFQEKAFTDKTVSIHWNQSSWWQNKEKIQPKTTKLKKTYKLIQLKTNGVL